MNKNPHVSIIVPVFNGGHSFRACVSSLLELDYPDEKLQIILINDGSTDDTARWLKEKKLPPNYKIITHSKNKGRAAARNSGIKIVEGEIIIFLDADMVVKPGFVNQHVSAISKRGVVAISGNVIANPDVPKSGLHDYLYGYSKRGAKQFGENNSIPFNYLITNNMSVKHGVVKECGLFDEGYIGYGGEDTDYSIRLWKLYPEGLRFSLKAISIDYQNEKLHDLQLKMENYGRSNYLQLLNNHPNYVNNLAGDWINSFKGKLVFNPAVNWFVKLVYIIIPIPYFVRYFIAYSLMQGARNPAEDIPRLEK